MKWRLSDRRFGKYAIVPEFSAEEQKLLEGEKSNLLNNLIIKKNEIRHIKTNGLISYSKDVTKHTGL
jgi:hypothetical protein